MSVLRTFKILHTADLHLGSLFSSTPEIANMRKAEQLDTLRRIADMTREQQSDALIIAGDLFDSIRVEEGLLLEVKDILSALDCRVFIAPGNHDPATPDSCYLTTEWPENVHIFKGPLECVTIEEQKTCIWGAGFSRRYEPETLLEKVRLNDNYINILVMHGEVVSDESVGSRYNPLPKNLLKSSKFNYCALGHIHKASVPSEGDASWFNCGCPEGRGFDESGDKGVFIGYVGLGFHEMKFRSVCKRKYITEKVDVSGCTVVSEFCDRIVKELASRSDGNWSDNIYDITLTGALPKGVMPDLHGITARLRELVCYAVVSDMTTVELDFSALMNDNSLRGAFVRNIVVKLEKDPKNRDKYLRALLYGLRAFDGEVKINEDN